MVSYNSIQEKKNLENQDDPTIFWEDERVWDWYGVKLQIKFESL
jgi:hypothetical protein